MCKDRETARIKGEKKRMNDYYNPYDDEEQERQRKRRRAVGTVVVALCLFAVIAATALLIKTTKSFLESISGTQRSEVTTQEAEAGTTQEEITSKIPSAAILPEVPADTQIIADIAEQALPSIVSITSRITTTSYDWFGRPYSQEGTGAGSGIIIDQTDESLLILTNYHVIEKAQEITVTYADDSTSAAVVKGADSDADLAVLSVALTDLEVGTMEAIRIAQMGDSDAIRMGEMVIAIGNALGYGQSVTVGYVSAKDRKVESDKGTSLALIQTDAAINPGNSGGALLNLKGEVIGINSVKYVEESVEGMGFAIPITTASPIIEDLKSREILSEEEKGYIGIVGENITDQIARAYHMPMGIYVYSVTENGPAEQAGLVIGDIIFKVNDKTVSSMDELKEKVNSYRAGETVEVSYYRNIGGNYEENTVSITLTKASDLKVPEN